jgi:hypothetical protein
MFYSFAFSPTSPIFSLGEYFFRTPYSPIVSLFSPLVVTSRLRSNGFPAPSRPASIQPSFQKLGVAGKEGADPASNSSQANGKQGNTTITQSLVRLSALPAQKKKQKQKKKN